MQPVISVPSLKDVKTLVDQRLTDYANVRKMTAQRIGGRYVFLWETISQLVNVGGKRFRPYMVIMAFSAYADDDAEIEPILSAALAQELIHLAMLIHDDIIDRDTVRYGIKNVAGQYEDFYAEHIADTAERAHMTQSAALLAGDVLISDAYRLMSKVDATPEKLAQATTILSNSIFDVVGGELLDTEGSFIADESITPEIIGKFKTTSYSFIGPLTTGALLGDASETDLRSIEKFGESLGIAYQLRDDLLGVFGDEQATGKSASSDITEGKHTLLIEQFEATANPIQKAAFYKAFHNPNATGTEIEKARKMLVDSGAKAKVEARIEQLGSEADALIESLEIPDEYKKAFHQLVDDCLKRAS